MKKTTALPLYSCLLLALTGGHAFAQGWPVDINSTSTNGLRVSLAGAMGIELTTDPTTGLPRILSYNRQTNVYGDLLIEHAPNAQGVLFKSNGNVGIGTFAPDARTTIQGATGQQLSFKDPNGTTRFAVHAQHGPSYYYEQNSGNYDFRLTTYKYFGSGGTLSFWTGNNTNVPSERVRITPTGYVGIGTDTNGPQALLHVAGDIRVDGNINAKFQDIAEWVPAAESLEPGMVVVVAPQNHVAASTEAYDTRVAGVISPRPGLTLGEEGESKVLVATTGRVKVRVDASNGPIREGDILVSSPIKGTAMKSEPLVLNGRRFHQPGTLIGKALESLENGTGEILVLLSMQ